jgi:error-prone DNA polymerase
VNAYAPLWCKSAFSFLEGASQPDELVETAHRLGLRALAVTDRDGLYGIVRAHVRARELGVKLITGSEIALAEGGSIVLLAADRAGYGSLCKLITRGRRRAAKGECELTLADVCAHAGGLIALWSGAPASPEPLREAFDDRLYALLARHRRAAEVEHEARLRAAASRCGMPLVAASEVLYHTPARRRLQDVLTCIRAGVSVHEAGTRLRANAEHALEDSAAFNVRFADDPAAVARTLEVAGRCAFSLADLRYRYPSERLPDGTTSGQWLRQLAFAGARGRYGGRVPAAVARQLERELAVIEDLDYPGYFLTMQEIVEFCRREGILCQGRGSAANSAVCYCLGITAVDPVRMDLLFERFLSRERNEPPDIDLDIAHERREEVIQHVYAKYGRERAAMVANVVRYRLRSAIREVGKALGLPATMLDRLARLASRYDGEGPAMLEHAGLDPRAPLHRWLIELSGEILGFPRHLSIHPGGFLLGHEPVDSIVPVENAAMAERTVIQWDKDDLEDLGLFKVDLLGLGALALVDRCTQLLRSHRGLDIDLATIPAEDPQTYAMICRADTVGTFQIESRAQMAMLPRLRPQTFYDLVIEVSIVRPGPIAGDMVHPFLRRRHGEEPVTYAHPSLEPVLGKTLGVPLFQEQVMRLAVVAADYTPGEADQLRRDMAAWRKHGRIEQHRERLISRMQSKGIEAQFAERVFEQIRGFGEYGFPESHAASFALIAYATAWLKCHHADAFACALLNAQPMGFYAPSTIVEDAKRHGVEVRPIDVNASAFDCTLEQGSGRWLALRMGLRQVKGLGEAQARAIAARAPYRDLDDLARRTVLDRRHLDALAECGALENLERSRRGALWQAWRLAQEPRDGLPLRVAEGAPAFPPLDALTTVAWDYRASQHSPRGHPLAALREELAQQKLATARAVAQLAHGAFVRTAGLVICRQRPSTANGVVFLTLEDETGFANVVVWEKVFARHAALLKTAAFLAVRGKVQRQDGVVHVVARHFWVPRVGRAPASGGSRDFH